MSGIGWMRNSSKYSRSHLRGMETLNQVQTGETGRNHQQSEDEVEMLEVATDTDGEGAGTVSSALQYSPDSAPSPPLLSAQERRVRKRLEQLRKAESWREGGRYK